MKGYKYKKWWIITILVFFFSIESYSQESFSTLAGYVRNEQKEPLVGATVKLEHSNLVAITDAEGRYTLKGQWSEKARICVSSIGYTDHVTIIGQRKTINVTLKEDAKLINEVVVKARTNVNAIDIRGMAGHVQSMDMKRVEAKPMIDFALSLQGQVPGLVVANGGELGSDPKIRIRGNSSLRVGNTTNEPLYVMDGQVITPETFYNLNPQDIKDIKVLKDAAACALYGVKAANGVLEITSQRGYHGHTIVSYSMNTGLTTRGRRGIRMMDSAEKLELERRLQNPETPGYRYNSSVKVRPSCNASVRSTPTGSTPSCATIFTTATTSASRAATSYHRFISRAITPIKVAASRATPSNAWGCGSISTNN